LPRLKEILHRIMSDPEIDVFLAIDSANCAVGLISLRSFPVLRLGGEQVSIEELVIAPEYRGMGIGEGLVNFAKHYARQKGAVRLEVLMNKNREGFHRNFYGKSGFEMAQNAVYRISLVKEKHT